MATPIMTDAEVADIARAVAPLLPLGARYLMIVAIPAGVKVLGSVPLAQVPSFLRETATNAEEELS